MERTKAAEPFNFVDLMEALRRSVSAEKGGSIESHRRLPILLAALPGSAAVRVRDTRRHRKAAMSKRHLSPSTYGSFRCVPGRTRKIYNLQ